MNQEALNIINQHPQNQAMGLAFNTDVLCPLQSAHDFCESENNYGVISGLMAGNFMKCAVANWGTFTVETLPPPDIYGCIKLKGEPVANAKVVVFQWRERPQKTRTDDKGCFEFESVASDNRSWITVRGPQVTE